jgi:hypothetical protein
MHARWEQMTRDVAARLAEAQAGYDVWEQATGPTRDRAVAADAELRRRHPDTRIEPLRAQLQPQPQAGPASTAEEPAGAPSRHLAPAAEHKAESAATRSAHASENSRMNRVAEQLREISARLDEADMRRADQARNKAAEITSMQLSSNDPDAAPAAAWVDDLRTRQREAVRHDPLPRVPHAPAIERAVEAGISDREAAD